MDLPPLLHQALFAAVRSANADAVRALLADAEPPMDLPPLSHHALFAAVRSANTAAVRALLADTETSDTSLAALAATQTDAGETALYVAAEARSKEVVRLLPVVLPRSVRHAASRLDFMVGHPLLLHFRGRSGACQPQDEGVLPRCLFWQWQDAPRRHIFGNMDKTVGCYGGISICCYGNVLDIQMATLRNRTIEHATRPAPWCPLTWVYS